jgi:ABC-type amino acid transport substrate-binding protein
MQRVVSISNFSDMRKLKHIAYLLLFLLSHQANSECLLKIRVNDAPPQYMQENERWVGRAIDYMESLLSETDCKARYVKMPWQRALVELEKGTIDAMMNMGYSESRAEKFYFISPEMRETRILFMRKDSVVSIESLDDLKKLPSKLAYEKGNIFDAAFTNKLDTDPVFREHIQAMSNGDLSEMVYAGRLSAEIKILENAKYHMQNNPKYAESMMIHPIQVSSLPTFLAFSKVSVPEALMLKLHQANIRAIAKGKYTSVKQKWGG